MILLRRGGAGCLQWRSIQPLLGFPWSRGGGGVVVRILREFTAILSQLFQPSELGEVILDGACGLWLAARNEAIDDHQQSVTGSIAWWADKGPHVLVNHQGRAEGQGWRASDETSLSHIAGGARLLSWRDAHAASPFEERTLFQSTAVMGALLCAPVPVPSTQG